MEDFELEEIICGKREFSASEYLWAINQHDFLWEYVRTQNEKERASLTDAELAEEIQRASWDYIRCTM